MEELLLNLSKFVQMIFNVIVKPNTGASNTDYSLFNWLFFYGGVMESNRIRAVLYLTFGIMVAGVSVGILKRFLWKN